MLNLQEKKIHKKNASVILTDQINSDAYRTLVKSNGLTTCRVLVKQTDLLISGFGDLKEKATYLVHKYRKHIENYIEMNPYFASSLVPVKQDYSAPAIIRSMIQSASRAGVGPMASVAGAIAEYVGLGLVPYSEEIIIENGGDIFIKSKTRREILLLAESSDFVGMRIAVDPVSEPIGVCTSSGKLGHSNSFGNADAVMVIGTSASFADAAATAIANIVKVPADLKKAIKRARQIGVTGIVILINEKIGAWGRVEILS